MRSLITSLSFIFPLFAYSSDFKIPKDQCLPNIYANTAIELMQKTTDNHFYELFLLQKDARDVLLQTCEMETRNGKEICQSFQKTLLEKVIEKIELDKKNLREVNKNEIPFYSSLPIALTSSINKYIGTSHEIGIYDEALTLLAKEGLNIVDKKLDYLSNVEHPQLVFKVIFLYMILVANNEENMNCLNYPSLLKLFYPVLLPDPIAEKLNTLGLFAGGSLNIPNIGFVFGGVPIKKEIKGVDCSAFLGFVTNSQTRLTTLAFEEAYDYTKNGRTGIHGLSDQVKIILKEYEIVKNLSDLKMGDLVVSRWTSGKSTAGHVFMALGSILPNREVYGVEALRFDDKSEEGIHVRLNNLNDQKKKFMVFRRK